MDNLKIFLSSTWVDLMPEREATERALQRLTSTRFVGMEYFGARDASPRTASLAEVDRCDIYVGVIGHRYGSGITEEEYRRALARGLPCLLYLKDGFREPDVTSGEDDQRQWSLRQEMTQRHTVVLFHTPEELATRVVADLHNTVFDRLLVQGMGGLRSDYQSRVQRFLAEYVGSPDHPIAFGGRDRELATLQRWFDDPGAAPYALLAGPAGRGKSALLVHWVRRLMRQSDIAVIFFPVSIRFRTNLASVVFASIAARLAALHEHVLPGAIDTPAEIWRELVSSYLARPVPHGRRFLLVLDGADECADWNMGPDLFPAFPPAGLKVLVSARFLAGDADSQGWLERLGWTRPQMAQSLELPPLTPQGLLQVLRHMSVPLDALSTRVDVVAELYRLTQGDPLLINLYVADLWTRGEDVVRLQVADLAGLEPGMEGFFRRWWEDQRSLWGSQSPLREPAFNDVLNVLACAFGPLLTGELLQLLPAARDIDVGPLEEILRDLKRFVIGDGHAQGYAFSHPRLGEFFHDRLRHAGRAEVLEGQFVSWGLRCVEELTATKLASTTVPVYVLQFLRRHMERAGCNASVFQVLAGKSWIAAWERLDRGSYIGFLSDLSRVRQIATQESEARSRLNAVSPFTGTELRCALCLSSIATLARDMSVGALKALIRHQVWSPAQAISYATHIPEPRARLSTLFELTAAIDDAYRPLALAAAVTETRGLCSSEAGIAVVSEVIGGLDEGVDPSTTAAQLARLFESVCLVVRQMPAGHDAWLSQRVLSASRSCATDERVAATLLTVAPFLNPDDEARERSRARDKIRSMADAPCPPVAAFAGDRLVLLRAMLDEEAGEADGAMVTEAIRCGSRLMTAVASTTPAHRPAAVDLALGCLPFLPHRELLDAARQIGAYLTGAHIDTFLGLVGGAPVDLQLRILTALLSRVTVEFRSAVGAALAALVTANPPGSDGWTRTLEAALPWLPVDELWVCLEQASLELGAAQQILFYDRLACERRDPEVVDGLAHRMLEALHNLKPQPQRLDALTGLVDWLFPAGAVDSWERWRPAPALQKLGPAVRRLLAVGNVPRPRVLAAAGLVLDSSGLASLSAPTLDELRMMVSGSPRTPSKAVAALDVPTGTSPQMMDRQKGESIAAAVLEMEPALNLHDSLLLLAGATQRFPGDVLRSAVGLVMEHVNEWRGTRAALQEILLLAGSGPLFPPSPETLAALQSLAEGVFKDTGGDRLQALRELQMPDIVRSEFLIAALRALPQPAADPANQAKLTEILLEVGRFASAPGSLLDEVLARLSESPAKRQEVVEHLIRLIGPSTLRRWLEVVGAFETALRREMLALLAARRIVEPATHWRGMIEAVQGMRSPRERARWLLDFVAIIDRPLIRELVPLATGLSDEQFRLLALCTLIPRLPGSERGPLLIEALGLARRRGANPVIGCGLIQIAIDADAGESVLAEAVATAVTLSDRTLRGSTLARLATVLPANAMANATLAIRRLDDPASLARAMKAVATAVSDAMHRQSAVEHLATFIAALRPGGTKGAAVIYLAPLLPAALRWILLAEALSQPADRTTGFAFDELFDSLVVAVRDAPAALLAKALAWLRTSPAGRARSQALLALLPCLPESLLPTAAARLAESGPITWGPQASYFPSTVVTRLRRQWGYLTPALQDALRHIERSQADAQPTPTVSPSMHARELERQLRIAGKDSELAATVKNLLLNESDPRPFKHLFIRAAARIKDASLRSGATRYLAAVCGAAQTEQACRLIARIETPAHRCAVALKLSMTVTGAERQRLHEQALHSAAAEPDSRARGFAAAEVAAHAPEQLKSALDIVLTSVDGAAIAEALQALIPRLADEAAAAAIEFSRRLTDDDERARLLNNVAPVLGPQSAASALNAAGELSSAVTRARLLCALLPRLDDALRPASEALLATVSTDFAWLGAIEAMAVRWPQSLTVERARSACQLLPGLADEEAIAARLGQFAPHWPSAAWPPFFGCLRCISASALRGEVIREVLWHHPESPPSGILAAIHEIDDEFHRAVSLGHLASIRHPIDQAQLTAAFDLADRGGRLSFLDALVCITTFSSTLTAPVLDELLASHPQWSRPELAAVGSVAPFMSSNQAARVLELIDDIPPGEDLADLLFTLSPRLDDIGLAKLLHKAHRQNERQRTELLMGVAGSIQESNRPAALAIALGTKSGTYRAAALCALLPYLGELHHETVIASLAAIADPMERRRRLLQISADIAPCAMDRFNDEIARVRRAQVVRAAEDLSYSSTPGGDTDAARTAASAGESSAAADHGVLQSLIDEALSTDAAPSARRPETRSRRARATTASPSFIERLNSLEAEPDRYLEIKHRLTALAPAELNLLVDELPHLTEDHRAEILIRIAPLFPGDHGARLLSAACDLGASARARALRGVVPHIAATSRAALHAYWSSLLERMSRDNRSTLLAEIETAVPVIAALGGDAGLVQVIHAIEDVGTLWP